jgi:hypothetical protein
LGWAVLTVSVWVVAQHIGKTSSSLVVERMGHNNAIEEAMRGSPLQHAGMRSKMCLEFRQVMLHTSRLNHIKDFMT